MQRLLSSGLLAVAAMAAALSSTAWAQEAFQLGFLAGSWTIHDDRGAQVGRSQIVVQAPGTMLYEERTIADEPVQALWFENAERNGGWTQLFVGPGGMTREFRPLSAPGEWPIVLGADVTLRDGSPVKFRMTMSRESSDRSRRLLEISRDSGASWEIVFDYHYRRAT